MYPEALISAILAFAFTLPIILIIRASKHSAYNTANTQRIFHEDMMNRALAERERLNRGWQLAKQKQQEKYETVNWEKEGF